MSIIIILFVLINSLFSAPEAITDLSVTNVNWRQIKLQWTVPVSAEPIAMYEIRVSTYKILSTELDWVNNSSENIYPYRVVISTSPLQGEVTSYTFYNLENNKTYFFAIKSSTSTSGEVMSTIDSNSSRPFGTPTNNSPPSFNLIYPTNGTVVVSQNIVFDWPDVSDIDVPYGDTLKYELYYSTFPNKLFSSTPPDITGANVVSNITSSELNFDALSLFDNTTYYWRIKCIDLEWLSSWSVQNENQGKFVINHTSEPPFAVSLIHPVMNSTTTSIPDGVFFDWTDAFDPDPNDYITYKLYVSSISNLEGFAVAVLGINYSSFTLPSIFGGWTENTTYWWYIIATDVAMLTSQSTTNYFFVNNINDSPINNYLIFPGTGSYIDPVPFVNTLNPIFSWTSTYDPDPYSKVYYQLIISTFSDEPEILNSIYYTTTDKLKYATFYHLTDFTLEEETTYFWRIKVWDEIYGEFSYSTTTYWFFTDAINLPPATAKLLNPLNNLTTRYFMPRFDWEEGFDTDIKGGISTQTLVYWNNFDTTTVNLLPGTSFYIPSVPLLNFTTYFWKIIIYDNGNPPPVLSSETVVRTFLILNNYPTEFQLLSPNNNEIVISSEVSFSWQSSSDPEGTLITYKIDFSSYSTFNFYISSETTNNNIILPVVQDNTTFYWRVISFDEELNYRICSSTFVFVLDYIAQSPVPFNLISPSNGSTFSLPKTTFSWQQTYDPDPFDFVRYNIIISTKADFSFIYHSSAGLVMSEYILGDEILKINNTYYWYVNAISTRTGNTVSNSTFTFVIKNLAPLVPELFFPTDDYISISSNIVLQWKPSSDYENDNFYYEVNVTTNQWLNSTIYHISQTSTTLELSLQDDTTYYWYVVAIDTFNNKTQSITRRFWARYDIKPPTQVILLDPIDKIISLPYTFYFSTATDTDIFDIVRYRIEISSISNFSFLTIVSSINVPQYNLTDYLISAGTYYWRIISYDTDFLETISSTKTFILPEYGITLSYPLNNLSITSLPEFTWSPVNPVVSIDTFTYKLIISSSASFNIKTEILTFEPKYKVTTLLFSGFTTYYWLVEGYDSYGRNSISQVNKFFTPNTRPLDPSGITISSDAKGILLKWLNVSKNEDESDFIDFHSYKIYRTIDFTSTQKTLLSITTSTFFIDETAGNIEYYYIIKTQNLWNIESSGNNIARLYNFEPAILFTSNDKTLIVTTSKKDIGETMITVVRRTDLETQSYPRYYIVSSEKTKLDTFVEITIMLPETTNNYELQFFDGINWQPVFYNKISKESNRLVFKTQYLGSYRLFLKTEEYEDKLTILGCSPYKRIITPNGDGINDEINFVYRTDSFLIGELYNLSGQKVCDLKSKQTNILFFDGKDNNGDYVLPGVYVYNITAKPQGDSFKEKSFRGTIVVKY